MSFSTPAELKYTRTHEWVRIAGDEAMIGITDYAQDSLGDVVFIELPEEGAELGASAIFGAVESVKAASDLFTPVGGTVTAVNSALLDRPELINSDPYGEGWMIRVKLGETAELLDADAYAAFVETVKH